MQDTLFQGSCSQAVSTFDNFNFGVVNDSALFFDVTQRLWVVTYRNFETVYWYHVKGQAVLDCLTLEGWTARLSRDVCDNYHSIQENEDLTENL